MTRYIAIAVYSVPGMLGRGVPSWWPVLQAATEHGPSARVQHQYIAQFSTGTAAVHCAWDPDECVVQAFHTSRVLFTATCFPRWVNRFATDMQAMPGCVTLPLSVYPLGPQEDLECILELERRLAIENHRERTAIRNAALRAQAPWRRA